MEKPKRWFWRRHPKIKLSKAAKSYLSERQKESWTKRKAPKEEEADWEVNMRMDYGGSKNKGRTSGHSLQAEATIFVRANNAEDAKLIAAEKIKLSVEKTGGKWSFSPDNWDAIGVNKVSQTGSNSVNYRWHKEQSYKQLKLV